MNFLRNAKANGFQVKLNRVGNGIGKITIVRNGTSYAFVWNPDEGSMEDAFDRCQDIPDEIKMLSVRTCTPEALPDNVII